MLNVVGRNGQVTIAKEVRERLGVKPGWLALQRLVDDHVEIHFIQPEHRQSLKGSLAKYIKASIPSGQEWDAAREAAWHEAAERKVRRR